jgi:flagellum-specific ATP synthase
MQRYLDALERSGHVRRIGRICRISGLGIEALGPDALVGEMCDIIPRGDGRDAVRGEVVGLREGRVVLMPYGAIEGIGLGSEVIARGEMPRYPAGPALLGRVLDAFGNPLDGGAPPLVARQRPLRATPVNPMRRPPVRDVLETGVRAIDALLTLGRGQRVGIFAGSGVGKSTLLGMIARNVRADVNVIALIGERGREVREFIERRLGPEGLARSVVVVATSDAPALTRARAAYAATAIAEDFRAQGRHVLLTMDSVTRFAMARREIGLAAGEPPTARGYTPSVFAELPELCERCGTSAEGGSITALYTVLVEGDDLNEPISDILRATLDGHVVLARRLAHEGHYPAIDVLQSTSRLFGDLARAEERRVALAATECLALYERNRSMVDIGAYKAGTNPQLDRTLEIMPALERVLRQDAAESGTRAHAISMLAAALGGKGTKP